MTTTLAQPEQKSDYTVALEVQLPFYLYARLQEHLETTTRDQDSMFVEALNALLPHSLPSPA